MASTSSAMARPPSTQYQKALVVKTVGQPVTTVWDRPIPQPSKNQVQLKVTVAGLNPHDQKVRDLGLFEGNSNPAVLANDVVGVVTKLGEGVTPEQYAVGDRIVLQSALSRASLENGLQEYAVADVGASCRIPDSISDDEAATLPTNLIAPLVALFDSLRIPAPWSPEAAGFDYAGTTLLVVGGGSNCGMFGVQLAKLAGIGRIVVVGGVKDKKKLFTYGATHIIDRHGGEDAVLSRIRQVLDSGDGEFDGDLLYAYDCVNPPEEQTLAINALSAYRRGTLARLRPDGDIDEGRVEPKSAGYDVRDVSGSSHLKWRLARPFWERLPGYLEEGKIRPLRFVVRHGLSAGHVNWALDAYRDGERVVKTHIHL